jgi:type I restriction enzyme M protein
MRRNNEFVISFCLVRTQTTGYVIAKQLLQDLLDNMAKRQSEVIQPLLIKELKNPKEVFRSLRNYLAGQFVGATRDDALLDELLKCLFCKLYMERGLAKEVPAETDVIAKAKHIRGIFASVRRDFSEVYGADTEILLDPDAVARVMEECDFSLLDAQSDPIGDAFEVFVGSESRGRAGQFFTPRIVTDFLVRAVNPQPGELIVDPACGAGGFLTSVARHFVANGTTPKELCALSQKTFFGIDKDSYLSQLAKIHVALLSGGHPNIFCADSIAMENGSSGFREELPKKGFDVVLTNPPFGTKIVAARPEILKTFSLAKRWKRNPKTDRLEPTMEVLAQVPPQVLFVERCMSLLKEGGRLGIVLPESVLSNKSYRHVMEYFLDYAEIEAVIGMPEALFKTSGKGGTHTKTCLVVARKGQEKKRSASIFMAEAKWCGHDSRARIIPNNDLPTIETNLGLHRNRKKLPVSPLGFSLKREDISSNVLCPRYYDPQLDAEVEALRETHHLFTFQELVDKGILRVSTGDELGKLAYGTGNVPFIRTSDISNWELKADPKHGVDRKLYETFKRKQDVRLHDILMVKDGTYLIGTCAIVSEQDREIIYQSHLYKITVEKNEDGIDPFLLLAVLTSPIVQRQIKSKQFTQDIIDSLGDRLYELVLPIPRSIEAQRRISDKVRQSVEFRMKARDLAKDAQKAVTELPSDPATRFVVAGNTAQKAANLG